MKLLNSIIILILSVLLSSCGGKKSGTTDASLSLGFGTLGDSTLVDGGIMIYGWADHGQRFGFRYTDQIVTLNNGKWEFAAFAWDDQALSGTIRCAYVPEVFLNGGNIVVPLNLSADNCKNNVFGGDDVRNPTTGVPNPLLFKTCGNKACLFDDEGYDEKQLRGVAQSFKVFLAGQDEAGNADVNNGVIGPCNTNTAPDPVLTLPGSSGTPTGNTILPILNLPITTVVRAYDEPGCSGDYDEYRFPNGVRAFQPDRTFFQPDGTQNVLTLKSDICRNPNTPSNLSGRNFRFWSTAIGNYPAVNYICTTPQFESIAGSGFLGETFSLEADLDMSSTSGYTPIGTSGTPFFGVFLGNEHLISNLTINLSSLSDGGIFGYIKGTSNTASIKSLNLSNITLNISSGSSVNNFGTLVGTVAEKSQISHIQASDINIDATSCSTCSNIGGLFGLMTSVSSSTSNEAYDIKINDVYIKTDLNISSVGGIAGRVGEGTDSGNSFLRHSVADGVTFDHATTGTSSNYGGIAGAVAGELWGVIAHNLDIGSTYGVNVSTNLGGVVEVIDGGGNSYGRVSYAKSSGEASSIINVPNTNNVGGVAGSITNADKIEDAVSSITIQDANQNIGGVVGKIMSSSSNQININRVRNYSNIIDCFDNCGGIAGYGYVNGSGDILLTQGHNYGNITSVSGSKIAGIMGYYSIYGGTLSKLEKIHNSGNITGFHNVGGLVGLRDGSNYDTNSFIKYGYNTGTITATNASGVSAGFVASVGTFEDGTIDELYNTGQVNGSFAYADFGSYYTPTTPANAAALDSVCYIASSVSASKFSGATTPNSLCTVFGATNDELTLSNYATFFDTTATGAWSDMSVINEPPRLREWHAMQELGDRTIGSEKDPFIIDTITKWNNIKDHKHLMNKAFKLGANLDFNGLTFQPIGSSTNPFTGIFNGNNYKVANITRDESSATDHLGVFRVIGERGFCSNPSFMDHATCLGNSGQWYVSDSAEISAFQEDWKENKKLYLENINFSSDGSGMAIGVLAGRIAEQPGTWGRGVRISGVEIIGGSVSNTGGASYTSGAIGYFDVQSMYSELRNISSSASISGDACSMYTGGIIAGIGTPANNLGTDNLRLNNLTYSGSINCPSSGYNIGGIIGSVSNNNTGTGVIEIESAKNLGDIVGNQYVGGIVGMSSAKVNIEASFSKGDITASDGAGGIAGSASGTIFTAVYAEGSIYTTSNKSAGLIAYCTTCTVNNSYSNVDVSSAGASVANLIAWSSSPTTSNNYYIDVTSNATDDSKGTFISDGDETNPANMPNISASLSDPVWMHFYGDTPRLYFEVIPAELLD